MYMRVIKTRKKKGRILLRTSSIKVGFIYFSSERPGRQPYEKQTASSNGEWELKTRKKIRKAPENKLNKIKPRLPFFGRAGRAAKQEDE